jgi:type IV pilus assembly protein PilY1
LGNWVNWRSLTGGTPESKMDIAKRVVQNIVQSTAGIRFGLMVFNNNQGGKLRVYNSYTASINDMDAIFTGSTTNRTALVNAITPIVADSWTPLAETLFETMRYYQGGASVFNSPTTYTSPILEACQKNYVVLVTDGMSTQDNDNVLRTICTTGANGIPGDCDQDGFEPANDPAKTYPNSGSDYLDDVAKYLYDNDMSTTFSGTQNVITYTVGFGLGGANAGAVKLLSETAANGHGVAYYSEDEAQLTDSLTQILGQIFEVNSSFVAPVVPVSPENRTYSGGRVYLGFFKPQNGTAFWLGNLKKYGISDAGAVVDKNGDRANYVDNDANGVDDVTGETLPADASNGSFRSTSVSYWTATPDQGDVDSGGVGQVLLDRNLGTTPRKIYTYMGSSVALTNASNAVTTTNAGITAAALGVADATAKDKLINYLHGYDAYDEDGDLVTNENREWMLGDILHSKPLVVNFASYVVSAANEANCSVNKTLVFAGANDGMVHAFRDCDGSEAWAFIPQDLLPNLNYLTGTTHTYFVDGSPAVYRYDADKDGNIEPAGGDKVILLIGERRGGGYYYALDVSDPENPQYSWRIGAATSPSGSNTDYAELGQTWSDIELTKIKVGSYAKMVGIIGAGYDNANEDGRYGITQTYNGLGTTSGDGGGNVTSSGASAALTPKGRGVYVVEIATVSDASGNVTAPNLTSSGWKVWGYTYTSNNTMSFSIPSSVAAVDTDYNGFTDRFYAGDTGGNMWAFDIGNTSTASWVARMIFSGNPGTLGATDRGRKLFYPPSVVFEYGYANLAFGTGDREHPLNTAVVDRLYSLKDRGQASAITETATPSQLVDVTDDLLQTSNDPSVIENLLSQLESQYGWYIRLENAGEKALAPALTFFNSYYTTYTPDGTTSSACEVAPLGTGRLYILDYKTGESVYNYDVSNDTTSAVYGKTDRSQVIGSGIPSGVVPIIPPDGDVTLLVGVGDGLPEPPPPDEDISISLYWRRVL